MKKSGFSLVELSIVLVILGLLTGGILGGQTLMRAAELRSVAQDFTKYQTAIHTFQDKYFALPGDMKNAVKFWGAAAGGTADGTDAACLALNHTNPSTGTETCNGNGDGTLVITEESWRAWQHLANAGLVEGHFTGVENAAAAASYPAFNVNLPASKIGNAGFQFDYRGDIASGSSFFFEGYYGNYMYFGTTGTNASINNGILKAEEAWGIDTKIDDGKPGTGKLRTMIGTHRTECVLADEIDAAVAQYDLANTTNGCAFLFSY